MKHRETVLHRRRALRGLGAPICLLFLAGFVGVLLLASPGSASAQNRPGSRRPAAPVAPVVTSGPSTSSIDNSVVRIGVFRDRDVETFRLISFKGDWTLSLNREVTASGTPLSQERSLVIPQGEFVSFMGSQKGFVVSVNDGEQLEGFDSAVLRGGELFSVEMLNRSNSIYRGELHVLRRVGLLELTNIVTVRDYLKANVSATMPSSEPEAIKAFIIVARTAIIDVRRRAATATVDLEDTDPLLEYPGAAAEREIVGLLIDQVGNQTLTWQGQPFFPRFQHTCGGRISTASEILGIADPVHRGMLDKWPDNNANVSCFHSPVFEWQFDCEKEDFQDFLDVTFAGGVQGTVAELQVVKRDSVGRITEARVVASNKLTTLTGEQLLKHLRHHFGRLAFKSLWYSVVEQQRTTLYNGRGMGLGMGMCLMGADGMCRKRATCQQILGFYYPGAQVVGVPPAAAGSPTRGQTGGNRRAAGRRNH